jgi:hypothetical protein
MTCAIFFGGVVAGTYQPKRVLRQEIPKRDGGVRELGIPCVRPVDPTGDTAGAAEVQSKGVEIEKGRCSLPG